MAKPRGRIRVVLLQVRSHLISLRQERACFVERCRISVDQLSCINLVDTPQLSWSDVADADAVMIGGAGAHSATDTHPFSEPLLEVIQQLIEDDRPVFASCWGQHFLAAACGSELVTDRDRSEVGTIDIRLTPVGVADPLFEGFPPVFAAQVGHNDRIRTLGPDVDQLAASEVCPNQVIRLRSKPVYGTQFHSEMNEDRLRERIEVYREDYLPDPEDFNRMIRSLRPSLEADQILTRFLEIYA